MGKSGANAPDRNRGRPPSGPPDRGATCVLACRAAGPVCRVGNLRGCQLWPRGRPQLAFVYLGVDGCAVRWLRVVFWRLRTSGRGGGGRRGVNRVARDEIRAPPTNNLGAGGDLLAGGVGALAFLGIFLFSFLPSFPPLSLFSPSSSPLCKPRMRGRTPPCATTCGIGVDRRLQHALAHARRAASSGVTAHHVSQKRPPARPAFGGHAEIFRKSSGMSQECQAHSPPQRPTSFRTCEPGAAALGGRRGVRCAPRNPKAAAARRQRG